MSWFVPPPGKMRRQRSVVQASQGDGRPCPSQMEQWKPCPVRPCYRWQYSPWSECRVEVCSSIIKSLHYIPQTSDFSSTSTSGSNDKMQLCQIRDGCAEQFEPKRGFLLKRILFSIDEEPSSCCSDCCFMRRAADQSDASLMLLH